MLKRLLIRLCLPVVWWFSRRRMVRSLQRFAVTEVDSAWQSLYAMRGTDDLRLRAKLFQHALEEMQHGALFGRAALRHADALPAIPMHEREPLYDPRRADGLVKFYATEHVGEARIHAEFETYRAAATSADVKELFAHVQKDEIGHARYTGEVLKELAPSAWRRGWIIVRSRARRAYEAWLRFSKGLGEIPAAVLLAVIYVLAGVVMGRKTRGAAP